MTLFTRYAAEFRYNLRDRSEKFVFDIGLGSQNRCLLLFGQTVLGQPVYRRKTVAPGSMSPRNATRWSGQARP